MSKRLYLNDIFFLMKLEDGRTVFVSDVEWVTEPIYREDIPFLLVFGILKEVLEDFFDN